MGRRFASLAITSALLASNQALALEYGRIFEPHRGDKTDAIEQVGGLLVIGTAGISPKVQGQLHVFDGGGQSKLATVNLVHSISDLKIDADGKLYVLGGQRFYSSYIGAEADAAYYSVLEPHDQKGLLLRKQKRFQLYVTYESIAVDNGKVFVATTRDRSLNELTPTGLKKVAELSGVGRVFQHNHSLYLIERKSANFGDENLVRYTPSKGIAERVFPADGDIVYATTFHGNGFTGILSNLTGREVTQFNLETGAIGPTVQLSGDPRAIGQLGQCAVVVTSDDKRIVFARFGASDAEILEEWNLSSTDPLLAHPTKVLVDASSKRVIVRSVNPRVIEQGAGNVVIWVANPDSTVFEKCLASEE